MSNTYDILNSIIDKLDGTKDVPQSYTPTIIQIGKLVICMGTEQMTASGSSVSNASKTVSYGVTYASIPFVFTNAQTTATTTVVRSSATNRTTTNFSLNFQRTNATETSVNWCSIGYIE